MEQTLDGKFSRTALENAFGSGFSSRGMAKHGQKTDVIDLNSKAVKDGVVKVKKDGTMDKRCQAVKQGLVTFNEKGELNVNKNSQLFANKELRTLSTQASHINSFEVADAIFNVTGLSVDQSEAEQVVRSLNRDDNLPLKSTDGNLSGTLTMPDGGDRALDQEIISSITNGTILSTKAASRARRQIALVLNSKGDMPDKVIEAYKTEYQKLKAEDGKVICRKNAKISSVKQGESRNFYSVSKTAAETGRKVDGDPDLRTKKGEEIVRRKETGLTASGELDMRTTKGKELAAVYSIAMEEKERAIWEQGRNQQEYQGRENKLKERQEEEQERKSRERQEIECQARERQDQLRRMAHERVERERQERVERERQERVEKERQERVEKERQERVERERQERVERERRERAERERQERVERERQERVERERRERAQREQMERVQQERVERERQERIRQERQTLHHNFIYRQPEMPVLPMPVFHPITSNIHHYGIPVSMFNILPPAPPMYHNHGVGRVNIPFQVGSSICGDGMKFYKGGQFVPGGGRAPKGGGYY